MSVPFVHCYSRTSDKASLREEGLTVTHGSRTQPVMAEKAWWQECEVARHTASMVGKQRETNAGPRLAFFLCVFWEPSPCDGAPYIQGGSFPHQLTFLSGNTLTDMPRSVS